ncbi:hypothetical protein PHBOTO_004200 [Pseudozyma hubeiensis]|nr:hypothetical protein PHBOTO_004200 [Pseudozyma hubeiensis]
MPAAPAPPQHHEAQLDDDDDDQVAEPPLPPSNVLRVAPGRLVDDVDEEIFLLYTLNAKSQHDGGLGYVNSSDDKIYVSIDGNKWSSALSDRNLSGKIIVPIYQHVTNLRSSKGDTGSVLWRSTVELAIRFHQGTLFDLSLLKNASVLELGAGTAALPAMVASLAKSWLATDQDLLEPLMRKNADSYNNVTVASLDWFDFLNPPSAHSAQLRKKHILDQLSSQSQGPDVIICCDCIYNPGLFDALIATLNVFTVKQRTVVLVSCEMRSDESLADFLTRWKASDQDWCIVSLEERFEKGFVALAAWKA